MRKIDDKFYNLDSKLEEPQCIGNELELLNFLRTQLETNERELFIVVESQNGNAQKWLKDDGKVMIENGEVTKSSVS